MPKGKSTEVLLIEDNFFMGQLLAERLMHEGLTATVVASGTEGLAHLKKTTPATVLVDIPLAGDLDGWKTLEAVRKENAALPILVLLNSDDAGDRERAQKAGATDIVIKADAQASDIVARAIELATGQPVEQEEKAPPQSAEPKKGKETLLERASGLQAGGPDLASRAGKLLAEMTEVLKQPEAQISIIKLVDDMMTYGFLVRASDIHMEPVENEFIARMRIDGILNDIFRFPKSLHSGIITRIKVLAGMRTDEHQAAQDGRFRMRITEPDKQFDVRVSVVPTYYGENAVLRLLAEQTSISSLDDLAFSDADRKKIRRAVQTPYGMILATGPTGSGKTTTLYTILKELNTREVQIITLEDPIEYSLEGVDQIQVNQRTGLTFAAGLRSILRQDPNIIMVGEIRDEETASIAVNAALTGHKLLATLHTNDAATTLPRLLDMGVEPFLVASTVNVALGQRLVRMICPHCKAPRRITEGEFTALKETIPAELLDDHRDFFQGKGCDVCHHTGYLGRMGIYEVLEVNDFIREAIMRRADAGEVKKIAVKNGMTTLLEDGFMKAVAGLTTIEEILRVIHE